MKQFLVFVALFLFAAQLSAQQRWTVSYQQKTLLKNKEEAPETNIIKIKKSTLSQAGYLTISFKINDGTVNRTVMADDSSRSGIKNWDHVKKTLSIKTADLKKLLNGRREILFYFTEIPKDPAVAAVVRMRPVHMFTMVIK